MKINNIRKVITVHDFKESSRKGLQKDNSRYLTSIEELMEAIKYVNDNGVVFDSFTNDYFNHTKTEITIDDGGGSSLLIADYLKTLDIRGRFFIITSLIGKEQFLNKDEIKYIKSLGHIIGTHSHTHPSPFCELNEIKIENEIIKSKLLIEELIDEKVIMFAIPGGEMRNETLKILAQDKMKIKHIYTSLPFKGVFKKINSCEFHGRLCIEKDMNVNQIIRYLIGKDWILNGINYKLRRLRREVIYKYKNIKTNK